MMMAAISATPNPLSRSWAAVATYGIPATTPATKAGAGDSCLTKSVGTVVLVHGTELQDLAFDVCHDRTRLKTGTIRH